jgi:hypothetical protein
MKQFLHTTAMLVCIPIILYSCSAAKASADQIKTNIQHSKEDATACFVQMTDGSTRNFRTLKLVTGVMTRPHLLADGSIKIFSNEITAYQNNEHYAVSQKTFCCGHTGNTAVETLPGFAIRIMKGKINVYRTKYSTGSGVINEFFVQSGNDGKIVAYSPAIMNDLLKNDPEASSLFNKKGEKDTLKKLQIAVNALNGNQDISTINK